MAVQDKCYNSKNKNVQYAVQHSLRLHPAQEKLIELTMKQPESIMLGSPDEIQLLQNLAIAIGAKKTLDVGVYTGYSALSLALALPADGKVVALDITDECVNIGKPIWKEAGVDHKIQFIKGSATESLEQLIRNGEAGTFDMAFIDADKENYDTYYELCLQLLRKNGIIVLDNMLWGGEVYNPEQNDPETTSLRALGLKVHADQRVSVSFLVLGDGTILAFKK